MFVYLEVMHNYNYFFDFELQGVLYINVSTALELLESLRINCLCTFAVLMEISHKNHSTLIMLSDRRLIHGQWHIILENASKNSDRLATFFPIPQHNRPLVDDKLFTGRLKLTDTANGTRQPLEMNYWCPGDTFQPALLLLIVIHYTQFHWEEEKCQTKVP